MLIDTIFAILIVLAIIKGYQRGLILGLFSLIAVIIGLAAAMKLSTAVAAYIGESVTVSAQWLPIISFAVVFIIVILLVRFCAKAIEKVFQVAMMGWLNRLGGILLFVSIYTIVFSVILFYAEQVHLIKEETISRSLAYPFVQPWGPKVINGFGTIIPLFKDMFGELEQFFEGISQKISLL